MFRKSKNKLEHKLPFRNHTINNQVKTSKFDAAYYVVLSIKSF